MITFKTLQEFINYVPQCLICKKHLQLSFTGYLTSVKDKRPRWAGGREALTLKFENRDGVLYSKHKSHVLHIDVATNVVLMGHDLVDRFDTGNFYFNKNCPTCHLKISTTWSAPQLKKEKRFPELTLASEELHFTMKGGKDLSVKKYYSVFAAEPDNENSAQLCLNHKYLPPVPFDFNKFNSFEQLVKRINTIVLFH